MGEIKGSYKLERLAKQIRNDIHFKEEWNSSGTATKVTAELRYSTYAIVMADFPDFSRIREYNSIKERLAKELLDKIYSPVYEPVYHLLHANKVLGRVKPSTLDGLCRMLDTINPTDLSTHEGINYILYMENKIKDLQAEIVYLNNVIKYR